MSLTLQHKYSYSSILIDFISPLLNNREDTEQFLMKAKAGMIVWNYVVVEQTNLPFKREMQLGLRKANASFPDFKVTLDTLVARKTLLYADHLQFIVKVESRVKPNGSVNLYVESVPVDKVDWNKTDFFSE
ncbi:MAG: hypothetical protein H7296_00970 [Bacteroidia bacterium]|nr:hypothetical protein [Bacteroidia bacterium]